MKGKKISLKDIAQRAGVSTALVSYVLNGKEKESRVGQEIAEKIRQIAKELHYQPNHLARSLRSGTTHTIGLIIADISNPFFANVARIVEDEAKKNGYTVIFGSSDEKEEKSWDLIQVMLHRQVDGFIIVSSEDSERQVSYLLENQVAFVLLDRYFLSLQTDFVAIDNFKASFDACLHLVDGGYQQIGMLAYASELFHMKERIRGYQTVFRTRRLTYHESWLKLVAIEELDEGVKQAMDDLLKGNTPVEAIIFATYSLAIAGLKYLNKLGLKIPDDMGIVSFGQADAFDLFYCPISYIKQPMEGLGKAAVHLLVNKLMKREDGPNHILMEAEFISRASSAAKIVKR